MERKSRTPCTAAKQGTEPVVLQENIWDHWWGEQGVSSDWLLLL